jgi:uncharacterized membrane protein
MKKVSLWLMVLLYFAAGINHFVSTSTYISIMPAYVPWHLQMVYISGVCEILFALLLIPASTRRFAAWLIIILLIAIFPANIQMAINDWNANNMQHWATVLRLPLQILLIVWAYSFTKKR